MDLSLYLLLAPATDSEQTPGIVQQIGRKAGQKVEQQARRERVVVFDPLRPGRVGSKRLVQASRKISLIPGSRPATIQLFGFGLSVCANALGFLAIAGTALMLLRVAEISLH